MQTKQHKLKLVGIPVTVAREKSMRKYTQEPTEKKTQLFYRFYADE